MKRTLPAILIAFFFLFPSASMGSKPTEWKVYFENDSVKIDYIYSNCEYTEAFNQEFVILKIVNKLNTELVLTWQEQLWYDNKCVNNEQDHGEFRKEIRLQARENIEGECNINSNLKIFSKFTDKVEDLPILGVDRIATLTRFELKNITIK